MDEKNKLLFSQYDIFDCFESKDEKFRFKGFVKRNLKERKIDNIEYKGVLKKNIKFYSFNELINIIKVNVKNIKTYNNPMYSLYYKFVNFIKDKYKYKEYDLTKENLAFIENFPKPKYFRNKWKRYYLLKQDINKLKRAKRRVKKKYTGKLLKEKLDDINNNINKLVKRRNEILMKLGEMKP
jgi:hypothetical protein